MAKKHFKSHFIKTNHDLYSDDQLCLIKSSFAEATQSLNLKAEKIGK